MIFAIWGISGLADLLKLNQPAPKSQAVRVESIGLNEKINLLAENVQSLIDRNQTIDNEIKTVQSNVDFIAKGLTNQIKQINVSLS